MLGVLAWSGAAPASAQSLKPAPTFTYALDEPRAAPPHPSAAQGSAQGDARTPGPGGPSVSLGPGAFDLSLDPPETPSLDAGHEAYGAAFAAYEARDYAQAEAMALEAAEANHGDALKLLGVMHAAGLAPEASDGAAARYLRRALTLTQDPDIAIQMGLLAQERRGGVDGPEGVAALQGAIEKGAPGAVAALARLLMTGADALDADPARARALLTQAAEAGDTAARRDLGLVLLEGRGGPPDPDQGLAWLTRAAEDGDREAAYEAGLAYADGTLAPLDDAQAAAWFERAAAAGHGRAAALRGVMSLLGAGAPQSQSDAVSWFRTASEVGDPLGRYYLALSYAKGEGAPRDLEAAYRLVVLSQAGGQLESAQENTDRARLRTALEAALPEAVLEAARAGALEATGTRLRR